MITQNQNKEYSILLPNKGRGKKEFDTLKKRREKQLNKAIEKLKKNPTNLKIKGIEKINDARFGEYTIRISKGYRLFYDVDHDKREVYIFRAGKHDLYKLI